MTLPIMYCWGEPSSCALMKSPHAGMKVSSVPANTPGSPGVVVTSPKLLTQFGGGSFSLNNARYTRYHLAGPAQQPDAILVLVPGFEGGASDFRIMRSHLLPHLVAPIVVYSTLIIAANILAEAGLSFLGLGIEQPTASWGNLLAAAPDFYLTQPWLMVWPGLSILLATLAFNLLGDGLRDAFDPRARI